MEQITKKQYKKAKAVCTKYLSQETEIISIIDNEIKRLNDLQDKSKVSDIKKKWIDLNKKNAIKMSNTVEGEWESNY